MVFKSKTINIGSGVVCSVNISEDSVVVITSGSGALSRKQIDSVMHVSTIKPAIFSYADGAYMYGDRVIERYGGMVRYA